MSYYLSIVVIWTIVLRTSKDLIISFFKAICAKLIRRSTCFYAFFVIVIAALSVVEVAVDTVGPSIFIARHA
jgi:hypothetical protein